MTFAVRFTEEAAADLVRLYEFGLNRDDGDWMFAERALDAIYAALFEIDSKDTVTGLAVRHQREEDYR